MNGEDRAAIDVLRAEIIGKLDLLLERTNHLRESDKDHEGRIRDIEEFGSMPAQDALREVRVVRTRVAYFSGVLAAVVFVTNLIAPSIRAALGL